MVTELGLWRLNYKLCVLQIFIFLNGTSSKPTPIFTATTNFGP